VGGGVVRYVGIIVERDRALCVEPRDVSAFRAGDHGVAEGLDVHLAFGRTVGIYAAAFGWIVAIVVAETAAGGAVISSGWLQAGVWSRPGESDPLVRAGEVDMDFADVGAGEIDVTERCVVGSGLLERSFFVREVGVVRSVGGWIECRFVRC